MRKVLGKVLAVIVLVASSNPARGEDAATRMLEATFKIYHKDSTATGVFVRPPQGLAAEPNQVLLVTAGHVFERIKGDDAVIVLRTPKSDATFVRRDFSVKLRDGGKPLWTKHPGHDVAVIAVKLPDDAAVRPIEFQWLADEAAMRAAKVHIGSELLVLGYPMQVESSAAGFPVARHACVASYPLFPVKSVQSFMAEFTTFAGDSGGPVFVTAPADKAKSGENPDARPLVLGIVVAQHFSDEKLNLLYEERMVHHPLNLSTVLYAQFMREVIEQLRIATEKRDDGR